ncbi:type II toxin-antitoxin system MqsA family antitoxin [Ethanoligenens sp.]|uniref:type II toxin-antitoxin system MqsA family antitoxin n=1 Tax=Ethanoligenens sp. TaxID=2099655 RepID=UPI0039E836CC
MDCFYCKGKLEKKATTFMVDVGNCIVIVKNVPSMVCSQCGEASYDNETAKQLERIVNAMQKDVAEIAVVNYPGRVA